MKAGSSTWWPRLLAAAVLYGVVQLPVQADDKPVCTAYKTDPLRFVKPGQVIRIKGGTVGCATPEAYDSFVQAVQGGNSARAAELSAARICYTAPKEGATVKVIQIRPAGNGFCNMQTVVFPDVGVGLSWTDVSMFDVGAEPATPARPKGRPEGA
jgi:hypothetical protein